MCASVITLEEARLRLEARGRLLALSAETRSALPKARPSAQREPSLSAALRLRGPAGARRGRGRGRRGGCGEKRERPRGAGAPDGVRGRGGARPEGGDAMLETLRERLLSVQQDFTSG